MEIYIYILLFLSLAVNALWISSEIIWRLIRRFSKKDKVMPCQHCFGNAELNSIRDFDGEHYYVNCSKCGITTPLGEKQEVIKKWNSRI